jgi:DNA-binding transcriptional MerR regulator
MSTNQKEETEKLYYSISEVSGMFDLNPSTLRFWEKEFDVLKPAKSKKGNRLFTRRDIEHIATIVELVKNKGFTIQGAREQMKKRAGQDANAEVIRRLREIRDKLIRLSDGLDESDGH